MNKIVRDFSSQQRYGVVTDTPTWEVLIPVVYEQVIPHKLGFSCKVPSLDEWEAFSLDGTPLLKNCTNVLFLDDNYLLFGTPNRKCILFNLDTKKTVGSMYFDSLLIFFGDADEATEFDATSDVFDIIMKTNYQLHGAHIENSLCAKHNGSWGIIDVTTNKIVKDFTHKTIIQKTGNDITVLD